MEATAHAPRRAIRAFMALESQLGVQSSSSSTLSRGSTSSALITPVATILHHCFQPL
jgi:hypothetical protein